MRNLTPLRYVSKEYKDWREKVFERDGYTCQVCGKKGGTLNAHHIRAWLKYPHLRFKLWNGITLCETCHGKVSTAEALWEHEFYSKTGGLQKLGKVFGEEFCRKKERKRIMTTKLDDDGAVKTNKGTFRGDKNTFKGVVPVDVADNIDDKIIDTTVEGNTYENGVISFGKKIIKPLVWLNPNEIRSNVDYQRVKKKKKIKELAADMAVNGFYSSKVVELNELLEAIDGQQRVEGAKEAEIETIPCEISTFPSKELEAAYFTYINTKVTALTSRELFKAQRISKGPYALLIYRLHEDPQSPAYQKVKGLIGSNTSIKGKDYIFLSVFTHVVNAVALNYNMNWKKSESQKLDRLASGVTYEKVVERLTPFLEFFYGSFGSRDVDTSVFKDKPFRSVCSFWIKLRRLDLVRTPSMRKALINKFKGFTFPGAAMKFGHKTLIAVLDDRYNAGKDDDNKI